MRLNELQNGNVISLQVNYTNHTYEFQSRVLGGKEQILILAESVLAGRRLRMPSDGNVNIIFQMMRKLYIWNHVNMETILYKGHYYYRIKNSDIESRPYNRRGAFRLYVGNRMPIDVYSDMGKAEYNVIIKDIREGGLSFASKEDIELKRRVSLEYKVDEKEFHLSAHIVRKVYNKEDGTYLYGCKFPEFYNELGSFIIKEQVKRRKASA